MTRSPLRRPGACFLGLCLAGAAASAETPEPSPPPGSWNVDWGDLRCSLIRRSEAAAPSFFALRTLPGNRRWEIRLVSAQWPADALDDPEQLRVSFQPGGAAVSGRVAVERAEGGPALVFYEVPESLLESFAASRAIRVEQAGRPLLEIALPAAGRALAAVRECESTAMREWGIDPATQPAVPAVPRDNTASLIRHYDYPAQALRSRLDGTVVFRMTVDGAGRISDCVTVVSSGHLILDRRTCSIVRERLRFSPALDARGHPVPAAMISSITWSIRS